MNLTEAYTEALLFANDLKMIHWHAAGIMFDFIHNKSQEYYEKATEDADWFAEEAIKMGQKAFNPSDIKSYIDEEVAPFTLEATDFNTFVHTISTMGEHYIAKLKELAESDIESWEISKVDEMLDYWTTEISYKIAGMQLEEAPIKNEPEEESLADYGSKDDDFLGIESAPRDTDSDEDYSTEEDIDDTEEDTSYEDNPTVFDNIDNTTLDDDITEEPDESSDEEETPNKKEESIDSIENPLDRLLDSRKTYCTKQKYIF